MQRQAVCGSAARQWAQRTEAEAARLRLLIPTCEVTTASRFKSGPSYKWPAKGGHWMIGRASPPRYFYMAYFVYKNA